MYTYNICNGISNMYVYIYIYVNGNKKGETLGLKMICSTRKKNIEM